MTDDNFFDSTPENAWNAWPLGQEWAKGQSLPADCAVSIPAPGVVVLRYAQSGDVWMDVFGVYVKERVANRPAPVTGASLVFCEELRARIERDARGVPTAWYHQAVDTWATPMGRRWLAAMSAAAAARRREEREEALSRNEAGKPAFAAAYAHLRAGGEPTTEVLAGLRATVGVGRGMLRDLPAEAVNISAVRANTCDHDLTANIDEKRAVAITINGVPWVMSARGADLRHAQLLPPTAVQFRLPRRSARGVRLDLTGADLRGAEIKYLSIAQMDLAGAKLEGLTVSGCVMPWRLLRELRRLGVDVSDCDTSDVPAVRYRQWRATSQRTLRHVAPVCNWSQLPEWHGPRPCPRYKYIARYARKTYEACIALVGDQTVPAHVSRRALAAAQAVGAADALLSGRYRGLGRRPSVERMEAAWAVITRATGWVGGGGPATMPLVKWDAEDDAYWEGEARWRRRVAR